MSKDDTWTHLKRDVRSLLMASKIGLDPIELQKEHINMLGHPIPLKQLGFKNVMDMVKMMPDVVTVHTRADGRLFLKAVSDESTRHIQELVTKQRMSKSERTKLMKANRPAVFLPINKPPPPPLPFCLKSQLCSLLSHGPIHLYDLETYFLYYYCYPLNVFNYGYYSIDEMLEAAADFIQILHGSVLVLREHMRPRQVFRPPPFPTDKRTGPIKPPTPATVKSVSKTTDTRAQTPAKSPGPVSYAERVVSSVQGTVSSAVKPCPESNHTQSDSQETERCDDGAKHVDACAESPRDEKLGRYEYAPAAAAAAVKWKDAETTSNSKAEESMSKSQPAIQKHAVPLDAMQSQRLKQPTRHGVHQMMAVHVEHIKSPGCFYIRFFETEEAKALENMMLEMRRCYSCPEVSARYRLRPQFVRRGQVCCVSPSRMWFYRVVIDQIVSSTQVEVYFVDFGSTAVVQSGNLKFLKSCYSELPAQAVPSSLAGITFTNGSWSAEAIVAFTVLCNDRTVVGALDRYVGDVLQLYLCDTRTKDDVYIHSVLLSQGHGKACSPAATAVHCVRVTPVSLYLGEAAIQLPEVELEALSSSELADMTESSSSSVEETIPPLELIDDNEASFHIQGIQTNRFSTPIRPDQTLNLSALGCNSWMSAILSSPPSSSQAPPDVTQTGTPPSACGVDLTTVNGTSPPIPASRGNSGASAAQHEQHDPDDTSNPETSGILEALSMHTPDLVQGLLPLRTSGFNFPLFGTRFITLHHSPQNESTATAQVTDS